MAFNPQSITPATLKSLVDNLVAHSKAHPLPAAPKRAQLQEAVAATLGWPNWHAAITAAKSHEPAAAAPSNLTDPWRFPVQPFRAQIQASPLGNKSQPSGSEKVWRAETKDLVRHAMVWGSEPARRDLLEHIAHLNPGRPLVIVHGPSSLPLRRWDGVLAARLNFDLALLMIPIDKLIESLVDRMFREDSLAAHARRSKQLGSSPGESSSGPTPEELNLIRKRQAFSMFKAVLSALVWLRKNKANWKLDITAFQDHLRLENIQVLATCSDLPPSLRQGLSDYLETLPGYQEGIRPLPNEAMAHHENFMAQARQPLDQAASAGFLLTARTALSSNTRVCIDAHSQDEDGLAFSLNEWVSKNQGGLLVFDSLDTQDHLWETLATRLPHWQDAGVGVWIGAHVADDLPQTTLRRRILARVADVLRLEGSTQEGMAPK